MHRGVDCRETSLKEAIGEGGTVARSRNDALGALFLGGSEGKQEGKDGGARLSVVPAGRTPRQAGGRLASLQLGGLGA